MGGRLERRWEEGGRRYRSLVYPHGGEEGELEKEVGEGVEKECDDEYSWCMQFSRAFS